MRLLPNAGSKRGWLSYMLGGKHGSSSVYRLTFGGDIPHRTERYANAREALRGANSLRQRQVRFAIVEVATGRELTERELERRAKEEDAHSAKRS